MYSHVNQNKGEFTLYYVNKKSIIKVEQRDDDFTVYTLAGEQLGVPGDYFASSLNGDKEVIPQEVFDEEYVAVELVETKPKKQLSPFEELSYQRFFGEMAKLNQEEDKDYIDNMKKLIENKAF